MSKEQKRIFLWTIPRSVSTAFSRAMMNRKNIKVLFEPFGRAFNFGPSRVSLRHQSEQINAEDTFENIRAICEQPYPECDEVFIKDMAYFMVDQPDYINLLPTGYIHTFLMRHPNKSLTSMYKLDKQLTGWDEFDLPGVGYKALFEMFELVKTKLGQEAIIIDADDLIAHPESILRQYCTQVGIEFQRSMVDWDDNAQTNIVCKDWPAAWFTRVLTSRGFEPSTTKRPSSLITPSLPEIVKEAILDSIPYYEKMYALRIKPVLDTV